MILPLALLSLLPTLMPVSAACEELNHLNLVFDGDSISAGCCTSPGEGLDAQTKRQLGGAPVVHNVAVGGRPVFTCLDLFLTLVAPLYRPGQPNVIAFHAGDNDINQNRSAAETYAKFTDYVAHAHAQGWKVAVTTELARYDFPPAKAQALQDYNALLRRNEAKADAVVDLDTEPRLQQQQYRRNPEVFNTDGVHPRDAGYRLIAGMLAPAIEQVARQ